ncbi:MAG TPA: hypothetical protein ENJ46_05735, partial [Hellea balneolensis]|nr:hypothetical protein [Hellea balneolensis]
VARLSDGREIAIQYTEVSKEEAPSGVAYFASDTPIDAGHVTLHIPYKTGYNMALNSAYKATRKVDGHEDNYIVTQFEPLGARQAFPSFDEPRFKVPFDLSITTPNSDRVYANTPQKSGEAAGEGWTKHVFETTRPLPTYLLAFGVGPWDIIDGYIMPPTAVRDHGVPLRGIATRGEGERMRYALDNTAGILEALEGYFGIPYPYEKLDLIAAPEYAFGAMENPGAIVYTEFLMMLDKDASLGQKRAYAGVNSHEMAHQWFGDLVTPVWWEDIWLNEAFATWMGNKAIDIWKPDGNFDRLTTNASLGAMAIDSLASTRKIREPLDRTENVMDQFDGITYRKGAGVLTMFESYLGKDRFQKGVRLHMKRFEDKVASADDFFQSLADGSQDAKVVPAMKSFVDQPGVPLVSGSLECTGGTPSISLSQSRYAPLGSTIKQGQVWQIPVCASYEAGGKVYKSCTLLTKQQSTWELEADSCPTWLTLNADGAGYYRFTMDTQSWAGLLDNLDALNPRETLAVLDSLEASFNAGKLDSKTYLDGLAAFAAHKEYDISSRAGRAIGGMYNTLLPASSHDDLARFTQALYAKRYNDIKDADSIEADLLAPTLAARLISFGADKNLEADFAHKGARYLGLDGPADKTALAAKVRGLGLAAAFKARGKEALPALKEMVKSGSPAEKGSAVTGLSSTTDPEMVAYLLEEALNNTEVFTSRQANGLLVGLLSDPANRDMVWDWFKENFDAFVETRVADVRRGGMPRFAGGFCSAQRAQEAEAFFTSKASLIPGYERSLAQTMEALNLCVAKKDAKAAELAEALKNR